MKHILLLIIIATFTASCCKEDDDGKATLVVTLEHHGKHIPNQVSYPDTVYVAFGATDAPGSSLGSYDTYFVGSGTDHNVNVTGLKCGDYFLFGTGKDSSGPYRVTGGMHVQIKHKERKSEKAVTLAVTE